MGKQSLTRASSKRMTMNHSSGKARVHRHFEPFKANDVVLSGSIPRKDVELVSTAESTPESSVAGTVDETSSMSLSSYSSSISLSSMVHKGAVPRRLSPPTSNGASSPPSFLDAATFGNRIKSNKEVSPKERQERAERVLRFARKRLKRSRVDDYYSYKHRFGPKDVLEVQHSDFVLGTTLGNGSYNVVYSVNSVKFPQEQTSFDPQNIVVKTLRSKLLKDTPMLAACAADLRKEGLLLAALQKKDETNQRQQQQCPGSNHILKVLAWTTTGLSGFGNGCHDSYFIVLERLDRTLSDTLKEWKEIETFRQHPESSVEDSKSGWSLWDSFARSRPKATQKIANDRHTEPNETSATPPADEVRFWTLRLGLLVDLCNAVSFLHSQGVIHRDLKPDNIGFDSAGTLKVFDFDVSRVLPPRTDPDSLFRLTKKVGSPRYMSPEVAQGGYYNEKTDVYAIGLMAYELLSLKRPFDGITNHGLVSSTNQTKIVFGRNSTCGYEDCVPVVTTVTNENCKRPWKPSTLLRSARKKNHESESKYANFRPLLPVATPRELADQPLPVSSKKTLSRMLFGKKTSPTKTKIHGATPGGANTTKHRINHVDFETTSFYWTQSLRTGIDESWSYNIRTRPSAKALKSILVAEMERIQKCSLR